MTDSLTVQNFQTTKAVLFDFDGPLCDVFESLPAEVIARRLQLKLGKQWGADDPLDLLELMEHGDIAELKRAEDGLIAAEVEAVTGSPAIAGGIEAIYACADAGLTVGIVSNNGATAISVFVQHFELNSLVKSIVGRAYAEPSKMKPNPWPLRLALDELQVNPSEALMVGDSLSDIQAAQALGIPVVSFANKPGKREKFEPYGVPIIESMAEFEKIIRSLPSISVN